LQPLAVVVLGGLITSTLLDQVVTPALFWKFGKPVGDKAIAEREAHKRAVESGRLPEDPDAHLFDNDLLVGVNLDGPITEENVNGRPSNVNGHTADGALDGAAVVKTTSDRRDDIGTSV
jgi:hypothetical protein